MAYQCDSCQNQFTADILNEEDNDTEFSTQFAEIKAGEVCEESIDEELEMEVTCPEDDCDGKFEVTVHAMVSVERNENGEFEDILEAQWEILDAE